MSLIPYHPREGREIVLRHHNSLVVRDPDSHRLEIRRTECPTCHQPLGRAHSPERSYDRQYDLNKEYVNPDYFRMLRSGNHSFHATDGPSSPVRRLAQPTLATEPSGQFVPVTESIDGDGEFLSSTRGVDQTEGSRIRREAFSPNYFKTFFVEETVLGRGGKGVVLLVRHEIDGCQLGHFACKRVPVGDDHDWLEKVLIEVELLAKLSHPNLVSYRHVWLENVQLTRFGPSVACAFILQQYCNSGDLHQHVVGGAPREATKEELKAQMRRRSKGQAEPPQNLLRSKPQLSFEDIYSIFKDITSGVAYLHAANYIHRDLKPSNCLLHKEGGKMTCLISDFGEVQPENVVRKSTGTTGTISYCAPEVLKVDTAGRYGNFTTKSDMFSLGMILYFMCFGRLPYQGANAVQEELEDIEQLREEITDWKGFQDERRERPDLPPRLYKLLKRMLSLDPAERPSAGEVLVAMKSDTSFDGLPRTDRNSNAPTALRGGRVQNLDSPAPSGTPMPGKTSLCDTNPVRYAPDGGYADPRKEKARNNGLTRDDASPWFKRTDREPERMLSREHSQRRDHGPGEDPDQSRGLHETPELGSLSMDEDAVPPCPPLLMAPPRTKSEEIRHQAGVAFHHLSSSLGPTPELLGYSGRLGIFLLKLATLGSPCWPYVPGLQISAPLIVVAALELGLPSLTAAAAAGRGTGGRNLVSSHLPAPGPGTTVALLVLHFCVLWLARRWNALCVAVPGNEWTGSITTPTDIWSRLQQGHLGRGKRLYN